MTRKICIAGGAGFIGSHMAMRLKAEGHYVVVADIKENQFLAESQFCNEFHLVDLRVLQNCLKVTKECDWVMNFAADMGGMGFITGNNATIMFNNTMLSFNICEASRINRVKRLFYSSSACVYPDFAQLDANSQGLKESDAWPAQPDSAYGLEKLYGEELHRHYAKDFGMEIRIVRFHNVFGPFGTWCGGREKAPAAICRKVIVASEGGEVEIWGDGLQTRSFCYIQDAIDGSLRLMNSDITEPINIGSDRLVSVLQLLELVSAIEGKRLKVKSVAGPQGVRGRNSDNNKVREVLKWEPKVTLEEGLALTYEWIKTEIERSVRTLGPGVVNTFTTSEVVYAKPPSTTDQNCNENGFDHHNHISRLA